MRPDLYCPILASVKPMEGLPGQLTSFIGRALTVELVGQRVAAHRMVSLVGPGGCGKTRLAIEVAGSAQCAPLGAVCFVDLSGLSDPGLVPEAVRSALGLAEVPGQATLRTLTERLCSQELLVVLDNCEHLRDACAVLADTLLRHCPGVRLLTTSRECLGVPGEVTVGVGGLELPDRSTAASKDWLERSEAGRLFIERARMARDSFALREDDAFAVADICERLDGIPLALELAAARVNVLNVRAIAEGLSDRFGLLAGTRRTGPYRHKTLLASIEWSCGLLKAPERALVYRLSAFASGFTLVAAEAVCSGGEVERDQVFGLVASLVEKSLVQALPEADRFRLHETMRAYGAAALEAEGSTAGLRDRHLGYFTKRAKAVGPRGPASDGASSLRSSLASDLDNVRASLDWAVESKQFDAAAELMGAVGELFFTGFLRSEASARCRELLAAPLGDRHRAEVLDWACRCRLSQSPTEALPLAEELTALGRSLGDQALLARGLMNEAYVHQMGEPHRAVVVLDDALPLAEKLGQLHLVVLGLMYKSSAYKLLCRPRDAVALAEEAARVAKETGWAWGEMRARANLAMVAVWAGQLRRALDQAEVVLGFAEQRSYPLLTAVAEIARGEVLYHQGDRAGAEVAERAHLVAVASGNLWLAACAEALKGKVLIWAGHVEEGYESLERGYAKLEAFGFGNYHVDNQAELVEAALWRGDLRSARHHLALYLCHAPGDDVPWAAPRLRAEARLARAECEPHRAQGLACDGLRLAYDAGALLYTIELLELVAITCADVGRHAEAARLLGAAERQRDLIGYVRSVPATDELAPVLVELRTALGQGAFEQTMTEGSALALEEAVAYAQRGRGSHNRARSGWESLTASERRVVSLVGQHLTNTEIGERLFISVSTVKCHLNHVFAKLGVTNRGQLAVVAHFQEPSTP